MFVQVARGTQGYKVVEYVPFRFRDLKEGQPQNLQLRYVIYLQRERKEDKFPLLLF